MKPCQAHVQVAKAALAAEGFEAGDDAVEWLWARHGEAILLRGTDLSSDFCPLCVVDAAAKDAPPAGPGSHGNAWASDAVGREVKARAQAAEEATQAEAQLQERARADAAAAAMAKAAAKAEADAAADRGAKIAEDLAAAAGLTKAPPA